MASSGSSAHATLLKFASSGSTVFTTIAEVGDISGPGLTAEAVEITNHSSTNGWREYVPGLLDGGEVSFSINYMPDDTTHDESAGLFYAMTERLTRFYQLLYPDDSYHIFQAIVTGLSPDNPVSGKLSADVTLKITGEVSQG